MFRSLGDATQATFVAIFTVSLCLPVVRLRDAVKYGHMINCVNLSLQSSCEGGLASRPYIYTV
jgi:hypothetical protein